ncbi:hypothetical protein OC834_002077 [Tilletia horrida]|uniref:Urea transporter n=1 Tax=Tilletia horrida TaxID=155126 RepID=A0AAN6JJT0_9BASI|nr:hypothetical protein OC842_004741 [Tilletia horrida]KAK0533894.1 hypothetical protein OC834_002077 [Tilletia horrida]KAK0540298.1 hypothetical protein OC835_000749 [Tilletia horrida]KAK0565229.1 hypothetical protein OC844_001325 [Tilletia horrida]
MSSAQVLTPGAGVGVVVGLGIGFAVFMVAIGFLSKRYAKIDASNNDEFSSASRNVQSGLIASGIVSAWTWAATLLQSSAVAYKFGISGPWWYAAGATLQVLLFAAIAAKLKTNAPFASTFLQVIRARWGKFAHRVFCCFALATNTLVSSMLIVGGSAVVNQLTGLSIYAVIWLTPLSVAIYTLTGGMRATLIADYLHTSVLIALILCFAFTVYASSDIIGSPSKLYEMLSKIPAVKGNAGGSLLTMRSKEGLVFGVVNIIGNFGTVFLDQSYHQRGIASATKTATTSFIMGGLAWTPVPLLMASSLGLAARALTGYPGMAELTASDVSKGLAAPAAAVALLGKGGAVAMLCLLFLAVTSALSAQLIAVSSVITYDIYQPVAKKPTEKSLFWVSHISVVIWAVCVGILGIIFYEIGISMGWLYVFMGTLIGAGVAPVCAALCWKKANKAACVYGALIGLGLAIMSWLVTAKALFGELTVDTTGADYPVLVGNLVAIMVPILILVPASYLYPENYSWTETRAIQAPDEIDESPIGTGGLATPDLEKTGGSEKASHEVLPTLENTLQKQTAVHHKHEVPTLDPKTERFATMLSIVLSVLLILLIPAFMCIPRVWSVGGLTAWTAIIIGWMFCSAGIVVIWPIIESRQALMEMVGGIFGDLTGSRKSA